MLKKLQIAFIEAILKYTGVKSLPPHMFFADDCFVVYRNLGFIRDQALQEAFLESDSDQTMYARFWRIWVYAWSMSTRWKSKGAIVDCGSYNGKQLSIGVRYCNKTLGAREGKIFAFDLFDNPPKEAKKHDHGPELHLKVEKLLEGQGDTEVVKGSLPEKLIEMNIDEITWAQVDLNSAEADLACFNQLIPKLADGAIVIFDDYGFNRYAETQRSVDEAVQKLGLRVLELPTGQGLLIFNA